MNISYYNRSDGPSMHKRRMSTHILGLGILMASGLILTVGLIIGLEFPKFARKRLVADQCIVDSGHKYYSKWVQESDFKMYKLMYFWNTSNLDDFLQGIQKPLVQEVGPYVYRVTRTKENIVFSGDKVSFSYRYKHSVDTQETKQLCGSRCTIEDKVFIPDPEELYQIQQMNNFNDFVVSRIPQMMKKTLDKISVLQTQQKQLAQQLMNCFNSSCQSSTSLVNTTELDVSELEDISFTSWIKRNDSAEKTGFLESGDYLAFRPSALDSFYAKLSDAQSLGVTKDHFLNTKLRSSCDDFLFKNICTLTDGENKTSADFADFNISQYLSSCGLFSVLRRFDSLTSDCLINASRLILNYVIADETDAFSDDNGIITSAKLIHDYILAHLWLAAKKNTVDWMQTTIFSPKHVRNFTFSAESFDSFGSLGVVSNTTWLWFTCLNKGHSTSNMKAAGFRIHSSVTETDGQTSFVTSPIHAQPCKTPEFTTMNIDLSVQVLRDDINFWKRSEEENDGHRVFKYQLQTDNFYVGSDCYRRKKGYSEEVDGILYSLPHNFNCSHSNGGNIFHFSPREDRHLSYVSVEPISGRIWNSVVRLQRNIAFPAMHEIGNSTFYGNVIPKDVIYPLFWSEERRKITTEEIQLFEEKVTSIINAACGGLIGMSVISVIVVVVSILVVVIPRGLNRVSPAPAEHMNGNHTPIT